MTQSFSRLIKAASWGRIALETSASSGPSTALITIEGEPEADLDGALSLAQRWLDFQSTSFTPMTAAVRQGHRLHLRRQVPIGSTLREFIDASGPLTEVQAAALFVELAGQVDRCHHAHLVIGELSPETLFVCPPGRESTAALRMHDAGLRLIVMAACGQAPQTPISPLVSQAHGHGSAIRALSPNTHRDLSALCDALVFSLTGRSPATEFDDQNDEQARTLAAHDRAPQLMVAVDEALQVGRAATISSACEALLPSAVQLLASEGGGPWERGSPLTALAVFAGTRLFDDRFETYMSPGVEVPDGAEDSRAERDANAQLRTALLRLDVQRAQARRQSVRKERHGLKIAIVVISLLIAATMIYFGARKPSEMGPWNDVEQAQRRLRRPPPPRPIKSIPLFRAGDSPDERP
ncbi:MAG TPA: hypothetical protein DCQ06_10705 [Myxococcales bacterium]|nr:hypothetical protein [Myxococcales bacterium]HAN32056.1 hypothetical protein [Myxococcales bacterium]